MDIRTFLLYFFILCFFTILLIWLFKPSLLRNLTKITFRFLSQVFLHHVMPKEASSVEVQTDENVSIAELKVFIEKKNAASENYIYNIMFEQKMEVLKHFEMINSNIHTLQSQLKELEVIIKNEKCQELINTYQEVVFPRRFYAGMPYSTTPLGFYDDDLKTVEKECFFIIDQKSANTADFSLIQNKEVETCLVENTNAFENACTISSGKFGATHIHITQIGHLSKQGNVWVIEEKIRIQLT